MDSSNVCVRGSTDVLGADRHVAPLSYWKVTIGVRKWEKICLIQLTVVYDCESTIINGQRAVTFRRKQINTVAPQICWWSKEPGTGSLPGWEPRLPGLGMPCQAMPEVFEFSGYFHFLSTQKFPLVGIRGFYFYLCAVGQTRKRGIGNSWPDPLHTLWEMDSKSESSWSGWVLGHVQRSAVISAQQGSTTHEQLCTWGCELSKCISVYIKTFALFKV